MTHQSVSISDLKNSTEESTFSENKQFSDKKNSKHFNSFDYQGANSSSGESSLGILDMDVVSDFSSSNEKNTENSRFERNKKDQYMKFASRLEPESKRETEWAARRPKNSINVSDIIEDRTIDGRVETPMTSDKFQPSEMTGRSTECIPQMKGLAKVVPVTSYHSPTVEEILATSIAPRIRDLCTSFQSLDANNDDDNIVNKARQLSFCESRPHDSFTSDQFVPAEQMRSRLAEDEKLWQDEFGVLPSTNTRSPDSDADSKNQYTSFAEMSARYRDRDTTSNFSMGNYFSRRCEDVRQMIPARSPVKAVRPFALVDTDGSAIDSSPEGKYTQLTSSFLTDDELKIRSQTNVDNATYDKVPLQSQPSSTSSSICSISTIERQLNLDQSPATIYENLAQQIKQPRQNKAEIIEPMNEHISYLTKPIPFAKPDKSGPVEILQVEKFYGNLNWDKFNNAPRVEVIAGNAKTVLSSTQNLPSFIETSDDRQYEDSEPELDRNTENKENINKRLNYTDDTEVLTDSNLEVTNSSSFQFNSISEYDASPRRRNASSQHQRDWDDFDYRQGISLKAEIEKNDVRPAIANPLPKNVIQNSVRPMASAPHLGNMDLDFPTRNNYRKHLDKNTVTSMVDSSNDNESAQTSRQFQLPMSPRHGTKYSLPSYGLATSPSALPQYSNHLATPAFRSSSQCSSNSEFTDGRLPLKSNQRELTWDCTELRHSSTKQFTIKNCAEKRLSLKVEVFGPGFQLTGFDVHTTLVLQAKECRTISVTFCPTIQGKARGKVLFYLTKCGDMNRAVNLFGYGGKTQILFRGLQQGPVGLPFLKMGDTSCLRTEMTQTFVIYNQGVINGVAYIGLKPESAQHLNRSCIKIVPNTCVIRPNSEVVVRVTYNFRKKDFLKLSKKSGDVVQIGLLEVFYGSEANRLRLQALLNKNQTSPDIVRVCKFIVTDFPVLTTENFDDFGESASRISDIFGFFKLKDFALTLNRCTVDETRLSETEFEISGIEESVMFKTLLSDISSCNIVAQQEDNQLQNLPDGTWSIHPRILRFDQRFITSQRITISNNFAKAQTFQLESNVRNLFSFSTDSGCIQPGQNYSIDIHVRENAYAPINVILTVYIESDSIDIPVDIRSAQPPF